MTRYANNDHNDQVSRDAAAEKSAGRRRGRPSVIDVDFVAETAIALWRERGFRTTGWKDIADATGVSVRTLIRHFGSRAEIPWVGVGAAAHRLASSLAAVSPDVPTGEALRLGIVESVTHSDQIFRAAPAWLEVVANEPDLMAMASRAYAPWTGAIALFIAHRHPQTPPELCHALASAYQAAAFSALMSWARAGCPGEPDLAVDRVLRWLDVRLPAAEPEGEPDRAAVTGDGADTPIQEENP